MYWAPGATHAPHHAPKEYIERFRGKFDMGWDKYRDQLFENQKKVGAIPAETRPTPRPVELPPWDSLTDDQQRLYARQMECFAGFLTHLDEHLALQRDAEALLRKRVGPHSSPSAPRDSPAGSPTPSPWSSTITFRSVPVKGNGAA